MSAALDSQAVAQALGEVAAEADRHGSLGVAQNGQVADGQFAGQRPGAIMELGERKDLVHDP